ncbi:MAG: hypothetical protein HGA96_05970 [Desulfobulbaceae bacterium]|nr:hypothetical protein [Desulfobulbaceae bacterium]
MPDLFRHQQVFRAVLFSSRFRGEHAAKIQEEVRIIASYLHGNDFEFAPSFVKWTIINDTKEVIADELFYHYLEHRHYEKFDQAHSISTWVTNYILLNIRNLRRRYRPRSREEYIAKNTDIYDERNKNFRLSYEEYEDWLDMTECLDNPEIILSAKELFNLMLGHFGKRNVQVMIGMITMRDAAVATGLNYDQYAKRLSLKRELFIQALYDIGYLPL